MYLTQQMFTTANVKAELEIGWIIVVCLYCYEHFVDYHVPCGIVKNIQLHAVMLLFSSHLFPFLLLIQSFHQGY